MYKISAMINTFNEEQNIEACLQSLRWVDELVVVDSGSTDGTVALAEQYADKVVAVAPGDFSAMRNAGLAQVTGEWVLVIDADERVSEELRQEILRTLAEPSVYTGFLMPRKNMFRQHWVRYGGWYPDYVLRLFRNDPQHRFIGKVHERVSLSGAVGRLQEPLTHYTYVGLEQYINKLNKYTTLSAQMMEEKGRRSTLVQMLFRPGLEFLKVYLLKAGFRDGIYGFIIAYMSSVYIFVKFAKLWLRQQRSAGM